MQPPPENRRRACSRVAPPQGLPVTYFCGENDAARIVLRILRPLVHCSVFHFPRPPAGHHRFRCRCGIYASLAFFADGLLSHFLLHSSSRHLSIYRCLHCWRLPRYITRFSAARDSRFATPFAAISTPPIADERAAPRFHHYAHFIHVISAISPSLNFSGSHAFTPVE